jgi:hypothetical protein
MVGATKLRVLPKGGLVMKTLIENSLVRPGLVVAGLAAAFLLVACGDGLGIEGPFQVTGYTVPSGNAPPTVKAGPDHFVVEGENVTLNGNARDDEWVSRVEWRQNRGPVVSLSNNNVSRSTFIAPPVSQRTELGFVLRAFDNQGQVGSDETSVFVDPIGGPPPDSPMEYYYLDFDSLPSAQGWTFMGAVLVENDTFFVDGSRLVQRTVDTGISGTARYQIDGIADPTKRMELSLTARVLNHEDLLGGSVGLGFNFYISDGAFAYRLALTDTLVQVGGQFYGLNTTDFHDYRFELYPGGNFDLYVDGVIFVAGVGSKLVLGNKIFFGDSTAHENTDAEIVAFSFAVGID